MKKVVRMMGLCALVALAFTSCKKNETNGTVTFKATINQPTSDARTEIVTSGNVKLVNWTDGDAIKVYNMEGVTSPIHTEGVNGFDASFSGDANFLKDLGVANSYIAFYPNAEKSGDQVTLRIGNEQNFKWNSFDTNTYPMCAFNDASGNFAFHSDAGILGLTFKLNSTAYEAAIPVTHLVLTANDVNNEDDVLSCTLNYALDGTYEIDQANRGNVITLLCPSNADLDPNRWTDFYFVLPEGALSAGFNVSIYNGDEQIGNFSTNKSQTIEKEVIRWMDRKEITPMN